MYPHQPAECIRCRTWTPWWSPAAVPIPFLNIFFSSCIVVKDIATLIVTTSPPVVHAIDINVSIYTHHHRVCVHRRGFGGGHVAGYQDAAPRVWGVYICVTFTSRYFLSDLCFQDIWFIGYRVEALDTYAKFLDYLCCFSFLMILMFPKYATNLSHREVMMIPSGMARAASSRREWF